MSSSCSHLEVCWCCAAICNEEYQYPTSLVGISKRRVIYKKDSQTTFDEDEVAVKETEGTGKMTIIFCR